MNILITSVGRRGYIVDYFTKALGDKGEVHIANSDSLTPARVHTKYFIQTPLIYSSEYIPFLLNYCQNHNIKIVLSLFDVDLPVLAKNKKKFEQKGIQVIVSSSEVIDICNDKLKTFQFCEKKGLLTPRTFVSIKNAVQGINEGLVNFPLIIKPRWGMGSIGIFVANNLEELKVLYKKSLNEISNSYLKYESRENLHQSVLIQEYLLGEEFGLDVINNLNEEYVNTIVKKKHSMRAGETDCAETVKYPELEALGEYISKSLKHIGNLDVDIFRVGNKHYILEMNARFGGGYPFSHMAGVRLPTAIIEWTKGNYVDRSTLSSRVGIISHKDINMVNLTI